MITNKGATVWWLDPQDFSLEYRHIFYSSLKKGTTYEHEAQWLMPHNVEHYCITHDHLDSREPLERLKEKAIYLLAERDKVK